MSTVEKSIRLYAWKTNYQTFQVVQGEDDSRRFNIQLFNTTIPVDLTNCSVKFFAVKPDQTKVYVNCDVIDAENGSVSVTLIDQMCVVDGTVDCWVQVIGDGGTDLRFEGLSLEVSACDLEGAIQGTESADDMKAFLQESVKLAAVETEVKNARVGADGTVYPSAGEAVKQQVGTLKRDLSQLSEELVASVPTDASIIFDYPNYKSGSGGDDGFYRRMYFFGDSTIKGTTTVLGSGRATLCLPYLLLQHVANASGKATTAESTSNKAIGGASFTTSAKTYFGSNGSLISDQITNLNSTQFGSIFISGGVNDWRASSAISEFRNSVSHVMDNLGQNLTNENTIVFWITPFLCPSCEGKNSAGLTLQDYRDAIVDVIHSKRKSSNIKHSIIDGRFLGLVDVDTLYYTDKLHPSAIGNEIIAKNIFDLLYDPTIS